ncbi:amidoligase family protein [Microvirga splendida]|uniref:Amidoligase family protein n=1 Tax=Microvirga splendida TaxID=2795727 RepID=A0ABS0Y913_9HYPH|nr:amidoligase family protein [Microvirga splendida]MBJ6128450.1 amidoligase family protein [Microvirga splendida]
MNNAAIDGDALSPPILLTADGSLRRVGVEIEFLGPSAQVAAEVLAHDLGGTCKAQDPHAFRVSGIGLGDLLVETDLRHVHPERHPELSLRLGRRMAAWLGTVASPFVPRELITAPMPIAQLPEMDTVVASLRSAGAYGRGAVLWDSLGLHFNIDPPRLDAATVTAFLKAFLLVNDRLRREIVHGSFRRALVLPPDYPQAYKQRVLDPGYWPDLPKLTEDYLAANPTRKRALDLLPLLAHFDEERVRSVLPHEKIGSRAVFHYRLPHAQLSDPAWSIMPDWRRWLLVERLASNLAELGEEGTVFLNLSA